MKRLVSSLLVVTSLIWQSALAQDDLDSLFDDTPAEPDGSSNDSGSATNQTPEPSAVIELKEEAPPELVREPPKRVIEEIVVTATKREQSLRDIPASISAFNGEDLEELGAQGQDDFIKMSPGVTLFDDGSNARRITVRGIASDNLTSVSTGILLDNIPFNDPYLPLVTADPNPFDLAQVEILKGPQGTLFGGSALNGAVRYVLRKPQPGIWEGKAFAQYESVSEGDAGLSYGGVFNLPLGDSAALRLTGHQRNSAGWIDELQRDEQDVNETEQWGGRALLRWQPDDRWTLDAMFMAQETDTADYPFADNEEGRLSRSNTPRPSPLNTRYDFQTLGLSYAFDRFDVISETGHTLKTSSFPADLSRLAGDNPLPSLVSIIDAESDSITQELRLVSNDESWGNWSWLAGVFGQRTDVLLFQDILASDSEIPGLGNIATALAPLVPGIGGYITVEGQLNTYSSTTDLQVTELAAFGELTWRLLPELDLTLGARIYEIESAGTVTSSGALVAANGTLTSGQLENTSSEGIKESGINPKLALFYTLNENISSFASIAKGFRFGGIQALAATPLTPDLPPVYKSDTIWSYEIGLRTQWLDNTLTADFTPFYIEWTDAQLVQIDITGLTKYIDNVGGAESLGAELALFYLPPLDGLSFSFSAAYVDTTTTEAFTTSNQVDIPPGTPWPLTAKWQTNSQIAYSRELFGWNLKATATYTTISEAYANLEQTAEVFDYANIDVGLALTPLNDSPYLPKLSLSVNNLTDERGIVGAYLTDQVPDRTYMRPRTLILRASFDLLD